MSSILTASFPISKQANRQLARRHGMTCNLNLTLRSLKSLPIGKQTGQIRLSEDDGPPAQSFIADDDDDLEMDDSDEPLSHHLLRGQQPPEIPLERPHASS